ncbi:MAG: 5-formyltetrahydrofolate cyclo-ligase [Acholeplasmatales bacterium]|jgi:5-formyltetrahydrofolate cyclo-ligase|nr:5-formyltetrahydrofolate cyclo-ligase [Acholeplasmataceae bacterium]MDD4090198.1 5-formyltetrahydrofolate cyclo-ligase [Acholeplasmataceae bacterium]MDY0115792.1 5-formyltetrahydrofolate cyclo-ligase [Acholeplasmatales bacterium]
MTKKRARTFFKEQYPMITKEEKQTRQKQLLTLISNLKEFQEALKVALYYPLYYEIDLTDLMEKFSEKQFYFPKVVKDSLNFYLVKDVNLLKPSVFGLKEPSESFLLEREIDLYLVPCLASSDNYRLGHGKGYYDKYFHQYKGYKVGIVYLRFKNLDITIDSHDIPMDVIL